MTDAVELVLRGLVAVVFAFAGVAKASRRDAFAGLVATLGAIGAPRVLRRGLAACVIGAEMATAVLLFVAPAIGHGAAMALSVAFALAIVRLVRSRSTVPCNCFGAGDQPVGASLVVRNALLVAIAGGGCALALTGRAGELAYPSALAPLALGAMLGYVLVRWEDLVFLLEPRGVR